MGMFQFNKIFRVIGTLNKNEKYFSYRKQVYILTTFFSGLDACNANQFTFVGKLLLAFLFFFLCCFTDISLNPLSIFRDRSLLLEYIMYNISSVSQGLLLLLLRQV